MPRIEIFELRSLIISRLQQQYPPDHAELMADSILYGELIGRRSHGIARILPNSFGPMDEAPSGEPTVERLTSGSARVVGGPGALIVAMATRTAGDIAAESGMAAVTTVGSHSTSGALSFYAEQLTGRGLICVIAANTVSFVTPPGGTQRILGTNPLCIGIPGDGYPLILDMATSSISGGEVLAALEAGETLPEGVAVDSSGNPTTDPEAVAGGGALLPFGGHRGTGLSIAVQVLVGALTGVADLPLTPEHDWGHFFLVIDPSSLRNDTGAIATQLMSSISATPTRDGAEVRIPGHRTLKLRDAALERGTVDVDDQAYNRVKELIER